MHFITYKKSTLITYLNQLFGTAYFDDFMKRVKCCCHSDTRYYFLLELNRSVH